jgi:uncharacterized secreted protein with C-terminal beta-propeller domain
MNRRTLFLGLVLILISLQAPLPTLAQETFTDVYETHFNKEAIDYLKEKGVVQGYEDGNFKPENRINRAEFTKILVASQYDAKTIETCMDRHGTAANDWDYHPFRDVNPGAWFYPYVCVAKEKNIISGYPDGTFKPASNINFAEASKIVDETLALEAESAPGQQWFAGYVKTLEARSAIPTTIESFEKNITRGEMSEVIWRLKEGIEEKPSATFEAMASEFPAIASCENLKDKFDEYQSRQGPIYYMREDFMGAPALAPQAEGTASAPTDSKTSTAADDFSSTNIQVAGVDEADIIKNDGQYIYMLKDRSVRIVRAYPADQMEEVASITYNEEGFNPTDLYINGTQLIVIGNRYAYYGDIRPMMKMSIMPPYPYEGSKTRVLVYDLSDISAPKQVRKVTLDGDLTTSRRIEDNLYLVLNQSPRYWIMEDVKSGADLLPQIQNGDADPEKMANCTDIHYFPGHAQPSYLIVASIPLKDEAKKVDTQVYLGASENVYSSRTHLYVATSQTDYSRYSDWDWSVDRTNTLVFKFALENGDITYKARGIVPGTILNQFSMDAYKNNFRIATTQNSWDPEHPSSNNIYVLDSDMKVAGKVEGIAPGEKIYSTRFMGDRLYMVTFKQIDPFFVIDLKTPTAPKILGKLKIPGVSQYLHPFDENHIIGFGKNTEESKEGDFAWFQGMKIALFDVTDIRNPKEQFVETIGDRGTESELLWNHKALLFDAEKGLIAFPVTVSEIDPAKKASATPEEQRFLYGTQVFQGAYVYHLDLTNGFDLQGKITHYTNADLLKLGDYFYDTLKNIQRILFIGENYYTVSQGLIQATDMKTFKKTNAVELQ